MEIGGITEPDFEASARHEGTVLELRLKGDASGDVLDGLNNLLTQLHGEAVQRAVSEAVIDMRELQFMSSSCFKCLVTWVTDIQSLAEGKQYRLRFISNPTIGWQKRSLRSLSCFAVNLVTIQE
jgi:hypothetical protein